MKTYVYFHICTINTWRTVVKKLYDKLINSGLLDHVDAFRITVLGDLSAVREIIVHPKLQVVFHSSNISFCERPCLEAIHIAAEEEPEPFKVFYLHSKGVKPKNDKHQACIQDWIDLMCYFGIENWSRCHKLLDQYSAVGVNILRGNSVLCNTQMTNKTPSNSQHFSGNFWWTNSKYILSLPYTVGSKYLDPEVWIGSGMGTLISLHQSSCRNHYFYRYPESMYKGKVQQHVFSVRNKLPLEERIRSKEIIKKLSDEEQQQSQPLLVGQESKPLIVGQPSQQSISKQKITIQDSVQESCKDSIVHVPKEDLFEKNTLQSIDLQRTEPQFAKQTLVVPVQKPDVVELAQRKPLKRPLFQEPIQQTEQVEVPPVPEPATFTKRLVPASATGGLRVQARRREYKNLYNNLSKKTIDKQIDKPNEQPIDKPIEKIVDKPINKPVQKSKYPRSIPSPTPPAPPPPAAKEAPAPPEINDSENNVVFSLRTLPQKEISTETQLISPAVPIVPRRSIIQQTRPKNNSVIAAGNFLFKGPVHRSVQQSLPQKIPDESVKDLSVKVPGIMTDVLQIPDPFGDSVEGSVNKSIEPTQKLVESTTGTTFSTVTALTASPASAATLAKTPIYIYFHICTIGRWQNVTQKLFNKLKSSGLIDVSEKVCVTILGDQINIAKKMLKHDKIAIEFSSSDKTIYERRCLELLRDRAEHENFKALYIHSKGLSFRSANFVDDWINLMIYFNIDRWQRCQQILDSFDTCGVNLNKALDRDLTRLATEKNVDNSHHYSGNFWWANSDYLKTLSTKIGIKYLDPELWIGSAHSKNMYSVWQSNVDHNRVSYPESIYRGKETKFIHCKHQ